MKLIKLHIDNFGALSNYDLDFDSDLTSILEDNGKGKTTIATFITVMLYGMSKPLKEQKDRERYFPFSGGICGGRLVCSHDGDTYEITRHFDKSRKAKDTLAIRKNHAPYVLQEDEEFGERILGLSESAFRRVCFINDNDLDFSDESIASKLGGLAGDFNATDVESAIDDITDAAKEIKALRGNGGLLNEAEAKLSETQAEIARLDGLQIPLMESQRKYHEAISKRNEVRKEITAKQATASNEERRKAADTLLNTLNKKKDDYKSFLDGYPNGIPTTEEIGRMQGNLRTIKTTNDTSRQLSKDDANHLQELTKRFGKNAPSSDNIQEINEKISEHESLEAALSHGNGPTDAEKDIVSRFNKNHPSEEDVAKMREKLSKYNKVSKEYENTDSTLGKVKKTVEKKAIKPLHIVLVVFGIAAIAGGIALCSVLLAFGIALIVCGALLSGIGISLLLRSKKTQEIIEEDGVINPEKQSLGNQRSDLRKDIATWLSNFYIDDPDPVSGMATFESEYSVYKTYCNAKENKEASTEEKKNSIKNLKDSIDSFFKEYGYEGGEYHTMLLDLQKDVADYGSLKKRQEANELSDSELLEAKNKANDALNEFCSKYGIETFNLSAWLDEAIKAEPTAEQLKSAVESAENEYKKYVSENPFDDAATSERSLEELQSDENELNQAIAQYKTSIGNFEAQREGLDELFHAEQELLERIEELKKRHRLLTSVKKNIEAAQKTIKEKYVGPIKKEFERYSTTIRETSGLTIDLDANLELRYLANGEYRKSLHLSSGEMMIVSFCLRLALLENMFKDSDVFVVLDDPFATLDDGNLSKVLKALKKINTSTQIVYFTCHNSRVPV